MCLSAKSDRERDLDQRRLCIQQRLRVFDPLSQQIFVGAVSRRGPELRGKMHTGKSGNPSQLRKPYRPTKVLFDVVLDAPKPPVWQGADLGAWKFEAREPHRQRLSDAAGERLVDRFAGSEQRSGELSCEHVAKQDKVIQMLSWATLRNW